MTLYKVVLNIHYVRMQLSGLWSPCLRLCDAFLPALIGTRTGPSKTSCDSWAYLRQSQNILHKVQTFS